MATKPPPSDVLYDKLHTHHKEAFGFISKALKLDEKIKANGNLTTATASNRQTLVSLYESGLSQLYAGLAVDRQKIGATYKQAKADELAKKMENSVRMVKERIEEIKTSSRRASSARAQQRTRPLSPTLRPSSSGSKPLAKAKRDESPLKQTKVRPNFEPPTRPKAAPIKRSGSTTSSKTDEARDALKKRVHSLKGIDSKLALSILDNVLETDSTVKFDDVLGLRAAKQALYEAVILPTINPEVFTGLRQPSKGILLFGPPGNGKTMLARAVASESACTFFNISASALTSKWVGEAEKLVKAMFAMAKQLQPSIIFMDEIDSVLCERSDKDNEVSRRLKTQFLVEFDGVTSSASDRVLVMGATNRPFDLDDAVIRRFKKRIYLDLPDVDSRTHLLEVLLRKQKSTLPRHELTTIAQATEGFSYSDLTFLAEEAAMEAVRELSAQKLAKVKASQLRPISIADLHQALTRIRPSAKPELIKRLQDYARDFGERGDR